MPGEPDRLDISRGSGRGIKKAFENYRGNVPENRRKLGGTGNLKLIHGNSDTGNQ